MPKKLRNSLLILLSATLFATLFISCQQKPKEEPQEKPTYLFLGDSIAEALLGPSPISERDSYGYYSIVGQINGAKYVNRAISGLTSIGFVNSLCQRRSYEEDDGFYREYWIKNADVIFISMLGNDVLCSDMIEFAIETGKATTAAGNVVLSEDYRSKLERRCIPNMREGMARIYELNPDVTVIWQTLYNPFFDASVLIDEEDWAWYNEEVKKGAIDQKYSFRQLADILVNAMNQVVYDYKRDNPDKKFIISDVKGDFDAVFKQGDEKGAELIFSDCIHPSVKGHALIAERLEKTLCESGLSSMDEATAKYKTVVKERADRLYPEDAAVQAAVDAADGFNAVSKAYFASTKDKSPTCKPNALPYENGNFFAEEEYLPLASLQLDEMELSTLDLTSEEFEVDEKLQKVIKLLFPDGIPILDKNDSYLDFMSDGTFELRLSVDQDLLSGVASLLKMLDVDLTDIDVVDFYENEPFCDYNTTYAMYFGELFPGFDVRELKKSLDLLSVAGCTVGGFDTNGEKFLAVETSLRETGKLPEGFTLPESLYISLNGYYTIEKLGEGEEERTVAYLSLVRTGKDTVPMFCALLKEDGLRKSALFKIEFCSVRIFFQS